MSTELAPINKAMNAMLSVSNEFEQLNTEKLNFRKECEFALQILKSNNYTLQAALENPDSLKNAIVNIAAVGLSLNPVLKQAYLIPRGKKVCADQSYMGLIQIATDTGSIKWAKPEIVKANDHFKYMGAGLRPIHDFDPFSTNRGEVIGVYCLAETHDGIILSEVMSKAEVEKIRDSKSESYKSSKSGPWKDDFEEMCKKTVVRRAYKYWPKTDRLTKAIELTDESFNVPSYARNDESSDNNTISEIKKILSRNNGWEKRILDHMTNKTKGKVIFKSVDDFNKDESEYALSVLQKQEAEEKTININ